MKKYKKILFKLKMNLLATNNKVKIRKKIVHFNEKLFLKLFIF